MPSTQERLKMARELIAQREYEGARAILKTIPDDPTAVQWLEKLEKVAPTKQASNAVSAKIRYILAIGIPLLVLVVVGGWLLLKSNSSDDVEIPEIAVIPTIAPSLTFVPSDTPLPTQTPSTTPTQTAIPTSTLTATSSPTPEPSFTPTSSHTPSPTQIEFTPTFDWRTAPTTIYYVTSPMVNIRACASTSCQVVRQASFRDPLNVVDQVSGESLQGNTMWMYLNLGDSDGYVHSSVVSVNLPPLPTATPLPSATPNYGSPENPYPSRSWAEFDEGKIRATRYIRPANSTVANFNMFNSEPSIGAEYVLVWFEVYCQQQTCDPAADLDIRLIDETGQIWGESLFAVLEPDLDMMSGLEGSTLAGWQLFEIPIGRSIKVFQVKWPKWFEDPLYVSWG